uniref:PRKCA-binding protein n=1 Tax=Acrobeloides nanus TaxID=290746 RepID=A0A914CQC8_9BILA
MLESQRGARLIADVAEIPKDDKNQIGVAIGGGAPYCPCLYVVQVFENSPCALDRRINPGDELISVNGVSVKGYEKIAVAELIRQSPSPVKLSFNKIIVEQGQGQTLDIFLKKVKHRFIEYMDSESADAFGLSRAILCNDLLAKLVNRLDAHVTFYTELINRLQDYSKYLYQMSRAQEGLGNALCELAVYESSIDQEFFSDIGQCHRIFHKEQALLVSKIQDVLDTLSNYVNKAIPDAKQSLKKYLDAKFEYLSFCLKIKEMEDEEVQMAAYPECLMRMQDGNYEYRVMLRCRQQSRQNFIETRNHVMVKIEVLDEKHVRDLAVQLRTIITAFKNFHGNSKDVLKERLKSRSGTCPADDSKSEQLLQNGNDDETNTQARLIVEATENTINELELISLDEPLVDINEL